MAADIGSIMYQALSWGDDQQNIPVSALGGLPNLPIQHTPDAANYFSSKI